MIFLTRFGSVRGPRAWSASAVRILNRGPPWWSVVMRPSFGRIRSHPGPGRSLLQKMKMFTVILPRFAKGGVFFVIVHADKGVKNI